MKSSAGKTGEVSHTFMGIEDVPGRNVLTLIISDRFHCFHSFIVAVCKIIYMGGPSLRSFFLSTNYFILFQYKPFIFQYKP